MTLKALAKRIAKSESYVCRLERGRRVNPSYELLERLCEVLQVSGGYFSVRMPTDANARAARSKGRATGTVDETGGREEVVKGDVTIGSTRFVRMGDDRLEVDIESGRGLRCTLKFKVEGGSLVVTRKTYRPAAGSPW
jgi:transcriptional regulator with XRE-family HTH domain